MDYIKEVVTSFRERLKSPFYSTFIVCWILINWKIVFIAISDNYETAYKIGKIDEYLNNLNYSIGLPIAISILFFFGYRWLEVMASLYVSYQKRVRDERELKQLKKFSVSGQELLEKTTLLEQLTNKYNKLKNEKSEVEIKLTKETDLTEKLTKSNLKLNQELQNIPNLKNRENLLGNWYVTYSEANSTQKSYELEIKKELTKIQFSRISGGNSAIIGLLLCYDFNSENIAFTLINSEHTGFVIGVFKIIKMDENGSFKHLSGWFASNIPGYSYEEVNIYSKIYYNQINDVASINNL